MMSRNICFKGVRWKIIPQFSLLLLIWSTVHIYSNEITKLLKMSANTLVFFCNFFFVTASANRSNVGSCLDSVIVIGVVVSVIVSNNFYPLCLAQFLSDEIPIVMKLHLSLHHACVSTVLVSCAGRV